MIEEMLFQHEMIYTEEYLYLAMCIGKIASKNPLILTRPFRI